MASSVSNPMTTSPSFAASAITLICPECTGSAAMATYTLPAVMLVTASPQDRRRLDYNERNPYILRLAADMRHDLEWDYTALADAYLARPDYAAAAIDRIAEITVLKPGVRVLDLGAGAGHLTIPLAQRGCSVLALEPNPAMRANGIERTRQFSNIRWIDRLMEDTGQQDGSLAVCTYGSSFGVTDRLATLREAARVLEDAGWLVFVFNHRVLSDPLQREIEDFVQSSLPDFSYGRRREAQTDVIAASGLFDAAMTFEVPISYSLPVSQWIDAWRSHATLQRQSGDLFPQLVEGIAEITMRRCADVVEVPY